MTNADINHYINWALYAVYGRLAEADHLMRIARDGIRKVAAVLRQRHPVAAVPLYRGMLVDPSRPLAVDPAFSFWSWSEDVDVARWFGSCEAFISEPFLAHHPEAQGVVLMLDRPQRVLFHHSWADAFGPHLSWMALRHPLCGAEGARQIAWSLRTQCEVITEPLAELPAARPVEAVTGVALPELDRRLSPPWIEL